MGPVSIETIESDVARTLVRAGTTFRRDQCEAYADALERESCEQPKWVLQQILENAEAGERCKAPLCDDTGIPHIFCQIGDEATLPPGFLPAVDRGIARGLCEMPGRPMAVRGDDVERITQSAGLFGEPEMLLPAPIQIRRIPGNAVRLTVLLYGGGPEIRGKTLRVFHKHDLKVVVDEMISWALEGTRLLGCQPCVLAYGIGRTNLEAASLGLEAMALGNLCEQNEIERTITEAVNESGVGPLGIGGETTVLSTFVKVGPQRASGVRIVSLRVGCCFDPRRATCAWQM